MKLEFILFIVLFAIPTFGDSKISWNEFEVELLLKKADTYEKLLPSIAQMRIYKSRCTTSTELGILNCIYWKRGAESYSLPYEIKELGILKEKSFSVWIGHIQKREVIEDLIQMKPWNQQELSILEGRARELDYIYRQKIQK